MRSALPSYGALIVKIKRVRAVHLGMAGVNMACAHTTYRPRIESSRNHQLCHAFHPDSVSIKYHGSPQ